jgi:gas vesicle protein
MSEMQTEQIQAEAATMAETGADLHAQVRDLTLRAMRDRAVSVGELSAVLRAVVEGLSIGFAKRTGEIKEASTQALAGLDEAIKKSAEATKLAAQQMVAQGKEFRDVDLKPTLDELKQLEESFLSTISQVAEKAGGRIKDEWASQVGHARRMGTDTGRLVADTLSDFGQRVGASAKEGASASAGATVEVKKRLTLLASGILAGMADALHEKATGQRK